jgi:hypothetical protein
MSTKNFRMFAIAAAVALTAVVASAPAFAWGSGAPTNSYDQSTRGHYYDYYQGR